MSKYKDCPGLRIKELREQRGWTLSEVAEFTGYSRVYLNNLELGKVPNPSITIIKKLAKLFALSIEQVWK